MNEGGTVSERSHTQLIVTLMPARPSPPSDVWACSYSDRMPDATPPRAFISHATEDKARFVTQFATALRAGGIDAWVDEWEIQAGDSLVDKVFTHGIDRARVFVVVLSDASISKPWVREELDAGMVRRISAGTKVIPVLLDDVHVPAALQHLRYVSVPRLGLAGAVEDVRASVFGLTVAPPIGPAPKYARRLPQLVPDPVDDAVLAAIVDIILERGRTSIGSAELLERLPEDGLTLDLVSEAIGSLREQSIIITERTFGGENCREVAAASLVARNLRSWDGRRRSPRSTSGAPGEYRW